MSPSQRLGGKTQSTTKNYSFNCFLPSTLSFILLSHCKFVLQNRLSSEKLSLIFLVSKRCKDILWSIHSTLWIRNLIPFLFFVQFWKGTDRFQNSDQSPLLMISDLHSIYLFIESRDGIMMGFEQKLDFPDRLWCQLQQGIYKSELHYGQPRLFFFILCLAQCYGAKS